MKKPRKKDLESKKKIIETKQKCKLQTSSVASSIPFVTGNAANLGPTDFSPNYTFTQKNSKAFSFGKRMKSMNN